MKTLLFSVVCMIMMIGILVLLGKMLQERLPFKTDESPGVSGTVTCVIPFNDRACWIFTARSVWLLVGDPVDTNNLQLKSYDVGTFSQGSADVTDVGEVYFLSKEGLCSCGLEGRVQNVSEENLREPLRKLMDLWLLMI